MSADRSVNVGCLVGLGGAVVVADAYVWQGGGRFWDVRSVLYR